MIYGGEIDFVGVVVDGCGDYCIVMLLVVVGFVVDGEMMIVGSEYVDVLFLNFFEVMCDFGVEMIEY